MQDVFDRLQQLQGVLAQKYQIERNLEELPKQMSTQVEVLARLVKSREEKIEVVANLKSALSALRIQLSETQGVREHAEKRMEGVKTQREFEALEKETNDAASEEERLRRALRKQEAEFIVAQENLAADEELIVEQEVELAKAQRRIEDESGQEKEHLGVLVAEENSLTPAMDPQLLFKFANIIRNKAGLGIVGVRSGVCSGCHIVLPAPFVNQVRMALQVEFCPYCSRVLFFEEDGGEEFFTGYMDMDDMGGLIDLVDEDDYEEEELPLIDDDMAGDYEDN
jgi:predicted  nucleic acid-binding Zn-ribbon protein